MTERPTPIEPACRPLAREGVFTYLDPWEAREQDIWQGAAWSAAGVGAVGGGKDWEFDAAARDKLRSSRAYEYSALFGRGHGKSLAQAKPTPRREPRGKRRSRQVRSTRARAQRRVEAREQRRAL